MKFDVTLQAVDAVAPPERLAVFRILTGGFALIYLLIRLPVFLALADRRADDFDGLGVFAWSSQPLPDAVFFGVVGATLVCGAGFVTGVGFRATGPLFALGMLTLVSYRSSWGQLLHFEILVVLHLCIVAVSPSADAYTIGPRGRRSSSGGDAGPTAASTDYGWPLAMCSLTLVITYVIAGIAKLRYGGLDWVLGDTLRNHVAYSAARLDVLGASPSPLARPAVRFDEVFPIAAAATVAIELLAPLALFGATLRNVWVAATWAMHLGIFALMLVGFPYPLFLVAFAPLYDLERLPPAIARGRQLLTRG
ncbi:MAG: hypothetical protein ACE37B_08890 [Ilumatobacter sp.]|uniref:hypothetical protein n=1 Tax=Ilumatobacter sp. TaxID=1967498 RepID=UPI003918FB86